MLFERSFHWNFGFMLSRILLPSFPFRIFRAFQDSMLRNFSKSSESKEMNYQKACVLEVALPHPKLKPCKLILPSSSSKLPIFLPWKIVQLHGFHGKRPPSKNAVKTAPWALPPISMLSEVSLTASRTKSATLGNIAWNVKTSRLQ